MTEISKNITHISWAVSFVAVTLLMAAIFSYIPVKQAEASGITIEITGTLVNDVILIDETNVGSEIICLVPPGCTVKGPGVACSIVVPPCTAWSITPSPNGMDTTYKVNGNVGAPDIVQIIDGSVPDNDEFEVKANSLFFAAIDGPGNDKYNIEGDAGTDVVNYFDGVGDDIVKFDAKVGTDTFAIVDTAGGPTSSDEYIGKNVELTQFFDSVGPDQDKIAMN